MSTQTSIPADWDVSDSSTWTLATTVDAITAEEADRVYRTFRDIRHSARDLDHDGPDDEDAAEWWANVLLPIHELECWEAESFEATIDAAYAAAGEKRDDSYDDIELLADVARAVLAAR